jgi:gas vesicle protein
MKRVLSFIVGTLAGGLVGATLALLFAPSSGQELRTQISDRTENLVADIRQAASTKRIELQERLDTLRAPKE